jgi:hypothetical protein
MAIFGIEGGIGTGKTMTMVYFALLDMDEKKKIYSNIKFKVKYPVEYLTKEKIGNIFELIKSGKFKMKNSSVFIQEAHNYIDSRNSASQKNKMLSYWILQSRHTGEGSCNIYYDTQDLGQVDIRLRRNTDYIFRPVISSLDEKGRPRSITGECFTKVRHELKRFTFNIEVNHVLGVYDTHEIVDF